MFPRMVRGGAGGVWREQVHTSGDDQGPIRGATLIARTTQLAGVLPGAGKAAPSPPFDLGDARTKGLDPGCWVEWGEVWVLFH